MNNLFICQRLAPSSIQLDEKPTALIVRGQSTSGGRAEIHHRAGIRCPFGAVFFDGFNPRRGGLRDLSVYSFESFTDNGAMKKRATFRTAEIANAGGVHP